MGAAEGPQVIGSYQTAALLGEEKNDVSHREAIRHLHLEPAGEEGGLERESRNHVTIPQGEFEDLADLCVVDALDDGHRQDDLGTCLPAALDGRELLRHEVGPSYPRIDFRGHAVEL